MTADRVGVRLYRALVAGLLVAFAAALLVNFFALADVSGAEQAWDSYAVPVAVDLGYLMLATAIWITCARWMWAPVVLLCGVSMFGAGAHAVDLQLGEAGVALRVLLAPLCLVLEQALISVREHLRGLRAQAEQDEQLREQREQLDDQQVNSPPDELTVRVIEIARTMHAEQGDVNMSALARALGMQRSRLTRAVGTKRDVLELVTSTATSNGNGHHEQGANR